MTIQRNRSLLTYKAETVYGTAPTGDFTPVLIMRDPEISPFVADRLERTTTRPWFGADRKRLINRRVTLSFSLEDGGSGSPGVAPAYGGLLVACGMAEATVASTSVTYTTVNTGMGSVAIRWFEDGIRHQVLGCFGTPTWRRNSGEFPMIEFEFQGLYSQPTDVAFTAATYANQGLPLEVNSTNTPTVTVNSVGCCMSEYELALNNSVTYSDYAGCIKRFEITGRNPEGRIQVEDKLIAGQNFYALAESDTLIPIVVGHIGATAGLRSTITTTNSDMYEPTFATRDENTRFINLPFSPISTDGTSELSAVYT
jgi:hypothetical protein